MSGTAAVAVLPWIIFNLVTYGAISAAEAVDRVTGAYQGVAPLSLSGLRQQWASAQGGFWEFQPASAFGGEYRKYLWVAVAVALALGLIRSVARRDWVSAARLGWVGLAVPFTFMTIMMIVYGVTGGRGLAIGRYFYPVAAAIACVLAGGWLGFFGIRNGIVALTGLMALAVASEATVTRRYVEVAYTTGLMQGAAPVVDQGWADEVAVVSGVVLDAPCFATGIGLGLEAPPVQLSVRSGSERATAPLVGRDSDMTLFRINDGLKGRLVIEFEKEQRLRISRHDRNPGTDLIGHPGDPLARVYCDVPDPRAARFRQLYGPQHPSFLTYGRVLAWNAGWVWLMRIASRSRCSQQYSHEPRVVSSPCHRVVDSGVCGERRRYEGESADGDGHSPGAPCPPVARERTSCPATGLPRDWARSGMTPAQ